MQTHGQLAHLSFQYSPLSKTSPADLRTGWQGRGVFAISPCLPPAEENRAQPVDPAQPHS